MKRRRKDISEEQWRRTKLELLQVLKWAACNETTVTYSQAVERVSTMDLHRQSPFLRRMLNEIAEEHLEMAGCMITVFITRESRDKNQPGKGFYATAATKGLYAAKSEQTAAEFAQAQIECATDYLRTLDIPPL